VSVETFFTETFHIRHGTADNFCFIHASDLHLGTPFTGLAETNEGVASVLKQASLEAFKNICRLALDKKASFLLLAGDIYDGLERGAYIQLKFHAELQKLSDAGIATFVVHGNHDPITSGWTSIDRWPKLVKFFSNKQKTEICAIESPTGLLASVQGISYKTRDTSENLSLRLKRPKEDGFHIGILHCNVAGVSSDHQNYAPCSIEDLKNTQLDYLALGHIHKHRILSGEPFSKAPWVVYAGNSQGRSPKSSELGPKGACLVSVSDSCVTSLEVIPCDLVRYLNIEVDVKGLTGLDQVKETCLDTIDHYIEMHSGRSLMIRAKLKGPTPLYRELCEYSALHEIADALNENLDINSTFAWWDTIENDTTPPLEMNTLLERDDFLSDLIKTSEELKKTLLADSNTYKDCLKDNLSNECQSTIREILDNPETASELIDAGLYHSINQLYKEEPVD
jgi:DNA repair exonuclease SbcCD nuclease subunit